MNGKHDAESWKSTQKKSFGIAILFAFGIPVCLVNLRTGKVQGLERLPHMDTIWIISNQPINQKLLTCLLFAAKRSRLFLAAETSN